MKKLLFILLTTISLQGFSNSKKPLSHIKSVTAITQVFGDGQKVTAAAIEYDSAIENSNLTVNDFSVEGRTITKVYVSAFAEKAENGTKGKYVIIELSEKDENAATFTQSGRQFVKKDIKLSIKQLGSIKTSGGETYNPSADLITNNKQVNLIVDSFKQFEFKDGKTGERIKYNLFIPKNYDTHKSYPLVLFIHDAGVLSTDTKTTLIQGLGAVVWASPSEQAKHECFVLAPQYDKVTVTDDDEGTKTLDATVRLVNNITHNYSIDRNRLYTTGQSMGCMSSIALAIKYPNLFAASFLVAGQWNPKKVTLLAQQKLWIVVSAGDLKAYPGMNAITDTLEKQGAKVSRAIWNGQSNAADFADDVNKMFYEGKDIKYTVLQKGTVVPSGMADDGGNNHIYTWRIAYTIDGIRDWLFAQKKTKVIEAQYKY